MSSGASRASSWKPPNQCKGSDPSYGKWVLKDDAGLSAIGITEKALKLQLKLGGSRFVVEYGNKVHAPAPYADHAFVYAVPRERTQAAA